MAYADFKSYIQANYENVLLEEVSKYINENDSVHVVNPISAIPLCEQKVDNLQIKTMFCHNDVGASIKMDIHCSVDIMSLSFDKLESDVGWRTRSFTVYVKAILKNGLHEFTPLKVEEHGQGEFEIEGALDEYLIPYISTDMLEEKAQDFLDFYIGKKDEYDTIVFPYEEVIRAMGIEMYYADLPENCFGRMYFRDDNISVYRKTLSSEKGNTENIEVHPGTMVLSTTAHFMHEFGTGLHAIAHEMIHWELHQKFFEILSLINEKNRMMSCVVEPEINIQGLDNLQKAMWWAEWQANSLASRILMPKKLFISFLKQKYTYEIEHRISTYRSFPAILEGTLEYMAEMFRVSIFAVKARAIQLGFDIAEGAFVYVDNEQYPAFSFAPHTLANNQTFIINKENYLHLYETNSVFAELIDLGLFIYTGYVVCINDEIYLERNDQYKLGLVLSARGANLANKCCLIFDKKYTHSNWKDTVFYNECYLCKDVSAECYIEAHYNSKFKNNQDTEQIAKEIKRMRNAKKKKKAVEVEIYKKNFQDTLKYHMERKGISFAVLAKRSGLSETTVKNYAYGKKSPVLENLMAIFVGLNLLPDYCYDLLQKAGKTLTDSDKDDIYRMLIDEHTDGDLEQWNDILKVAEYDSIPKNKKK